MTLLAEIPDNEATKSCVLKPVVPRVLQGPCVEPVEAFCAGVDAKLNIFFTRPKGISKGAIID